MPQVDLCAAVEVGDGAGDLQDAVVGAGGEAQTVHGVLQDLLPGWRDGAILPYHSTRHLGVAEDVVVVGKSLLLYFPRRHHTLSDVGTLLSHFVAGEFLVADRNYFNVQIGTSWDYRGRFI